MGQTLHNATVLLALLANGLVAGTFFAFSSFVMGALARLPAPQGIAAMQSINIVVINPLFMGVFLGSGVLSAVLLIVALRDLGAPGALAVAVAAGLCLAGSLGVTMLLNVPLNDALAGADPAVAQSAQLWTRYLADWTFWNSVRGLAAAGAVLALAVSLMQRAA